MGIDRKEMFEKSRGWKDAGGEMKEWEGRVAEKEQRRCTIPRKPQEMKKKGNQRAKWK